MKDEAVPSWLYFGGHRIERGLWEVDGVRIRVVEHPGGRMTFEPATRLDVIKSLWNTIKYKIGMAR